MMLLALDQVGPRERERVGGKAWGLARLHAHGLPVPPAVVVPVEVFETFLQEEGLWELARQGGSAALARSIRSARLGASLCTAIDQSVRHLGGVLAVRSSAVGEDGQDASHAGQFASFIGVAPGEGLEKAILGCWASAFSLSARTYGTGRRGSSARGGTPSRMAAWRGRRPPWAMGVVIQAVVEPRTAGVLFTINPTTGSWGEMTLEAAWGHAHAVVSGRVHPDFYRVRRPRRLPSRVQSLLAMAGLPVIERTVQQQAEQWRVGEGGLVPRPVPPDRRTQAKLTEAELQRLCRLGLRVEGLLGGPQDIEWALDRWGELHLLQARPVTATRSVRRSGPVVWTSRFIGERWTEPATPLGWSEMRRLLHWFIAYPGTSRKYLGGEEPTRLIRFAPYLNVTVFRHLSFKFPGAPPPRFMVELLPPEEEENWLRRHAHPPDLRVYASVLAETIADRRWRRFRWNPATNWRAWGRFERSLGQALEDMPDHFDGRDQARARLDACRGLARDYIKIHICSLLFANIGYEMSAAALVGAGRDDLVASLLRAPGETWTVQCNQALWRLGRGEVSLEEVLEAYGHRASNSWELFSPRWAESPETVLRLAETAARGADPVRGAIQVATEVDKALADLTPSVRSLVTLTRRYLQLREDQRFHYDRLLWRWKQGALWLEQHLDLEIRYLEAGELDALLDGSLSRERATVLVERRRKAWLEESKRRVRGEAPPAFIVGDEAVSGTAHGARLRGMGISSGVATGTVRVLHSLEDVERLRPGDILVARATDPGWTPLFLTAGGLVMELGSMLGHGAVVAREYGLPAVVNVPGATMRLVDGQTVTVDGGRGLVWVR